MKRYVMIMLAALLTAVMLVCMSGCDLSVKPTDKEAEGTNSGGFETVMGDGVVEFPLIDADNDDFTARIELADGRVIELELYYEIAPQTVSNFVYLARRGFYDGLTFHRIAPGFVIQGGDPLGNGTGGPGYFIRGEFESNGFDNKLLHTDGVLSMARRSKPYDSAGCQFFIVLGDQPGLDGDYAAFGLVTSGMDVVNDIASVATDAYSKPLTDVVIRTITVEGPEIPVPID